MAAGEASGPSDTTASSTTTSSSTTTLPPYDGWVDPASSGGPWGDTVTGLLTFRGNPTRTYYGEGPVPDAPEVRKELALYYDEITRLGGEP